MFRPTREQSVQLRVLVPIAVAGCSVFVQLRDRDGYMNTARIRDLAAILESLADLLEACESVPLHEEPVTPQ